MTAAQTKPIMHNKSAMLSLSAGLFAGYSIRETAGNSAVIRFRDGHDTNDPRNILLSISLAPAESARDWFLPTGIAYTYGLYVEIVSGDIEGSAQVSPGGN